VSTPLPEIPVQIKSNHIHPAEARQQAIMGPYGHGKANGRILINKRSNEEEKLRQEQCQRHVDYIPAGYVPELFEQRIRSQSREHKYH